ncbi:MAG: hypothetical protein JO306_02410 [Gemmatimonadetes bacterium]|nr:hypothetical protein [Gemmatimonadota bacterium]
MLNLTLKRIEREIRHLPVEHAYGLHPDSGVLWRATDHRPSQVTFTPAQLASLDGAILTHNHPGGRSLSRADVLLACRWNLTEIRAVTSRYTYSIRTAPDRWGPAHEAALRELIDWEGDLLNRLLNREIERGVLTDHEAELTFHHRLWERLTARDALRYSAQRYPALTLKG